MRPVAFVLAGVLLTGGCSLRDDLAIADRAAARFHEQLNAVELPAIYAASSPEFKATVAPERFAAALGDVRRRFGDYVSGTRRGFSDNSVGGRHTVSFDFDAVYRRRPALERFVFLLDEGRASLVDYNIVAGAP